MGAWSGAGRRLTDYTASCEQDAMGGGQGVQQPTKGVGGYRPTINWREIAVRRKLVADKQVLACIVASGVVIMTAGVILTVLGFLVIASQCPFKWLKGAGACYYMAPHNATWEEGRSYCTSQSAALLHLHSAAEADFIAGVMAGRSWLGARRKAGQQGSWVWVDSGATLNYTGWSTYSPASLQKPLCAAVEPSGTWIAEECDAGEMAYVICDYKPGYNPFVLVGPVVAGCGVVVLVLSVEVCVRRREFISKNAKPDDIDDDDDRQVDEGIINYGYGNFGGVEEEEEEGKRKTEEEEEEEKNPYLQRIQQVVVSPERVREEKEKAEQEEEDKKETTEGDEDASSSPKVKVVPASPASLSPPSIDENSPSQENLELLLSPKTLE